MSSEGVDDKATGQKSPSARSKDSQSTPEKRLHFRHSESETVSYINFLLRKKKKRKKTNAKFSNIQVLFI